MALLRENVEKGSEREIVASLTIRARSVAGYNAL
jgi:hypothetical protein